MKKNIYIMYAISLLQGMVFYGSIATLYRQADGFWDFMLERVLLAVICAGLSGVDSSILYLSCEKGKSQLVFSIHDNLGMIGLLLAAGIYSLLPADNYSLSAFLTVITYGIAMLLTLALSEVKESEGHEPFQMQEGFTILKETLHNPKLLFLILSVALITETHHTITVFLNQLQYISVGMTSQSISVVYMIVTLSSLLGIFSTLGTKRLGKKTFGKLLLFFCFVACLILTFTQSALLSIASIFLLNICFSLFQPLQKEQQNEAITTSNRATALSIHSVIIDSMSVFITMVLGKIADVHVSGAFGIGAALCLGALLLYSMSQTQKSS